MDNKYKIGVKCVFHMLFLVTLSVQAASFDCSKSATKIETLICSDDELSKLDDDLNKSYKQAIAQSNNNQELVEDQRHWLKHVQRVCNDVACLKNSYQERIAYLGELGKKTPINATNNSGINHREDTVKSNGYKQYGVNSCARNEGCEKMVMLYSGNDQICKPLLGVYQSLLNINNHDVEYQSRSKINPSNKGEWENVYPDVFAKAGFKDPPHFNDDNHGYIEAPKTAFYKLKLEPKMKEEVVLVQDYYFSGIELSTDIYISEPGKDISTKCSLDHFALLDSFVDGNGVLHDPNEQACRGVARTHNELSFATIFVKPLGFNGVDAKTIIDNKYVFRKGNLPKELSIEAPLIQRVYLYKNQVILTARNSVNTSLVYQIDKDNKPNDICYFRSELSN